MKFSSDSPRALSVLGFTRSSNVCHNRRAGDQVLVVIAREGDEVGSFGMLVADFVFCLVMYGCYYVFEYMLSIVHYFFLIII